MKTPLSQLATGIGIVLVGALLLLDTLGVTTNAFATWWPLFMIGAGMIVLMNDLRNYLWGAMLVLGGVLFQLWNLHILSVNPWEFFWPVLIILVGVSLLLNRNQHPRLTKEESDDVSAILGGVDQVNSAHDYKGGNINAVFGGVKIDMRKAIIKKEATLNVFAFCGGIELVVPEDVVVKPQASCILGGIENKRYSTGVKDAPVLYITGTVTMGGIEIKT